jgi:hypothetical protein
MTSRIARPGLCLVVALFGFSQLAAAATLCVSATPVAACPFSTITAAVAAASNGDVIQVMQGTYHEDVVIGKSISLAGAGSANTIINAAGLSNGIYVDGLDHPGLTGVSISSFRIQNANFEGILVTNASGVTIGDVHVLNNNLKLDINTPACPGIPPFETSEGEDCGEGIHLSGADHSIVAGSVVEKNSGGILITDDTGPAHDNLILGNTVQDNPFDCGITLASHPLFGVTGPPQAAGVYHNTITGNLSTRNGFQVPGAGAGVGIFAPAPFNANYANVVVNNELTDNGLPGVALHAHAPGANLADNMIVGNRISGNGPDTADTATPGPAGINISGGDNGSGVPLAVITGTVIAGNVIRQETDDVVTKTNAMTAVHFNDFLDLQVGIDNLNGGSVNAQLNWWGCVQGPTSPDCASVSGSGIFYVPFLTSSF